MSLLSVNSLNVTFTTPDGPVIAVRDLSFDVAPGEVLGIVGESGSGKTQAAMAVVGLLAGNGRATGSIRFEDRELLGAPERELARIRGARISVVFQDPMTSLNPYLTIGGQMGMVLARHRGLKGRAAVGECARLLGAVQITDPDRRLAMYPHELSGGMRQRVMIATALLCQPALLIADEPTTALDVTVQVQILTLLSELRRQFGTAVILITHDLGIVAGTCDRMLVMRRGECVESGAVAALFRAPRHPYTQALLAAVPRLDAPLPERSVVADAPPLLTTADVGVRFTIDGGILSPGRQLHAVDGVSVELRAGETLGVVGESGSGKSTLARAMLGLIPAATGQVTLLGRQLAGLEPEAMRLMRRDIQLVFQDPLAALNPRMTVRDIVAEPLRTFEPALGAAQREQRVSAMLTRVGLEPRHMNRYPHQFSGGQCQRIGIARALILRPKVVICDEPVSALDVTVQAQVVALLQELQRELGIALIFIAHDLAVVRRISHRVLVMYLGRTMEIAPAESIYASPLHPYTRALVDAVPVPDPAIERQRARTLLGGEIPSPLAPPSGCVFRTRCPIAIQRCSDERPVLRPLDRAVVACHRAGEAVAGARPLEPVT